jgi:hypothetical protein
MSVNPDTVNALVEELLSTIEFSSTDASAAETVSAAFTLALRVTKGAIAISPTPANLATLRVAAWQVYSAIPAESATTH